ncbi:MAG: hypothetical protein K8I02_05410, partial [Candidatus Methylomirabilis sp.]|nr:hypothetical protein [Deltaproteobacteria bacterium]
MTASMLYALASMSAAGLSDLFYKTAAREGLRTARFLRLQSVFFFMTLVAAAALWFDFRFTFFAAWLGGLCGALAFGG